MSEVIEKFRKLCERLGGRMEERFSEVFGEIYACILPNPMKVEMLKYNPSLKVATLDFGFTHEDLPAEFVTVRARPSEFGFVSGDLMPSSTAIFEFETKKIVLTVGKSKKIWLELF